MKFEKEEDRLNFVIELLNHPELLREVRVQEWLAESRNKELYEECRRYLEGGLRLVVGDQLDVEGEYRNFTQKMKSGGRSRRMTWFSVAAAVVILISASWWLLENSLSSKKQEVIPVAEHIVPGRNQAVLITESGEELVLNASGRESRELGEGVSVEYDSLRGINYKLTERAVVSYHTLRVPKGAEYKLTLNDGTVVWLNSESELRYPTSFAGEKREVFLKGEGYFSVAHDEQHPFIVVSSDIYTKVYGTEFNIRSYGEEDVHVTLVQGRVSVKKTEDGSEYTLNPGENARFAESVPEITKVNVNRYIAWKDGYFYYENESLESIMDDLKRWYGFDVVYVGNQVKDYRFELWASRDSEISVISDLLMKTNRVGIKVNGKTLVVSEVIR
ncbi:FecR family protein [Butyricimonas paravirosa]|uniref:FecR family protein n=1 Tax=Butyricimonas paravirosa TaxID=1472417 RepID=UPI002A80564B|nr:FecR domain-containing protein [Butyricimonas paravirosa]